MQATSSVLTTSERDGDLPVDVRSKENRAAGELLHGRLAERALTLVFRVGWHRRFLRATGRMKKARKKT
jgi:hypothetical protein